MVSSIVSSSRRSWSLFCWIALWLQILLLQQPTNALTEDESICGEEKNTYANCVFRMEPPSQGKACDTCRINAFRDLTFQFEDAMTIDDDSTTTCTDIETDMCAAVHSCSDCGECKDEMEAFWRCSAETETNDTCTINCFTESTPTSNGPLCPAQFDAYKTCVLDELPEAQVSACDDCRLQASSRIPDNVEDCSVVQDIFCHAIQTCDCGACRTPLQDYLDCDVYKRWFGECNVDCAGYNINKEGLGNNIAQSLSGGVNMRHTSSDMLVLGLVLACSLALVTL